MVQNETFLNQNRSDSARIKHEFARFCRFFSPCVTLIISRNLSASTTMSLQAKRINPPVPLETQPFSNNGETGIERAFWEAISRELAAIARRAASLSRNLRFRDTCACRRKNGAARQFVAC
jgi:hypothetical protein